MKTCYLLIFLVIIIISCASFTTSENIQKAEAHYQIGLSYYNENDIQRAYIEFLKALEFNPEDKEVLNAIGIIQLLKFDDFNSAIEYFKRALLVDQNFSEANLNLGFAYEKTGRLNDAIESYKKALSNPMYQNPEKAYNNLGRVYYRTRQYDKAIEAFKGALRRVNDFYPSYYRLALCYNAKGFYGDASTALQRAIELDPLYQGDKEKARKDFEDRKLLVGEEEAQDIIDFIEILRY